MRVLYSCFVLSVCVCAIYAGFGHLPAAIHLTADNLYETPCPGIFDYYLREGVLQYGVIKADCPDETTIQLFVELSVGNNVQGYNGDLVLAASRSETIQNILQRKPIMYRLNFPRWFNYPPKVTKITINGRLICQGPPIDIKAVRVLTTINLQHTLKLNVPPNMQDVFPSGGFHEHSYTHTTPDHQPTPDIEFNPTPPLNPYFFDGTQKVPITVYTSTSTLPPLQPHVNEQVRPQISQSGDAGANIWRPPTVPSVSIRPVDRIGFNAYGVNSDECGITFNTNALIANGRNVQKGQYPWLVAIFMVKSLGPEFLCGANLISHKHVITAGHCMKTSTSVLAPEKIFMRIGEHNIHQWTQVTGSRTVGAARITVHQDYKVMSADGDIALIALGEEVDFTKFIRPICLWSEDIALDRIVSQLGTVVGWGKDEQNNLITPEPKQLKFPVVSQEDCLRSHFTFREITSERTFCAGYKNGSGPCNGDSGGGFILERGGRWTLRGIVSMGIAKDRNCDFSQYFVFADITKYLDWILNNL